ncbi:transmembrane channel-like protein 5 [Phlebotomus argentipes]|uniref:transmembrane channel-like protein 5 n=1 Tax=Phlebotomus argentipes TaxID=94469 RepID=UPI0028931C2D|nr:transmembrane channel-like protein 5 [Phlebotomus argentipes]
MHRRRTNLSSVFHIDDDSGGGPSTSFAEREIHSQDNLLRMDFSEKNTCFADELKLWGSQRGDHSLIQKTINFMPSRFKRQLSLDFRLSGGRQNDVDNLAQQMEQNNQLMADNPLSRHLRIETIRSLPQTINIKREIRTKLSTSARNRTDSRAISQWQRFKYGYRILRTRLGAFLADTLTNLEIWYGSMRNIEGHFGSGVSAYFKFLRWLFISYCIVAVLCFGFIVLPQLLLNKHRGGFKPTTMFKFLDIFTGEGYLTTTVLFYGGYSNETISIIPKNDYNLPMAYFLTMICVYLITFVIMSVSMARSYRRTFIEASGITSTYADKIFCAWDFGISNEKMARLAHKSLFNELREMLSELEMPQIEQTLIQKFWSVALKVSSHFLILFMLAGLGVGMWTMLRHFDAAEDVTRSFSYLYLPICINFIMLAMQMIFGYIARMEGYKSSRTRIHITLMRNFLLEVVIIGVLLGYWISHAKTQCWETAIGQEIYRLVIVDFVISIAGVTLYQIVKSILSKSFPAIGAPEFDISQASLSLVFNQTLFFIGLLYSPILPVIVIVKMILMFYILKAILIKYCKPPAKLWKSTQTHTLYLVMSFLSLLGVLVANGYVMTQVKVSQTCGPFRNFNFMYEIVTQNIAKLTKEHLFWRIVVSITRPAFVGGILLGMCVIVYYLRSKSRARIGMVKLLKEMLYMEARDKEFLLGHIMKLAQQSDGHAE